MAPGEVHHLGDALIPVINKLQDIFSQVSVDLKLSLPQVAVIGSQSSGKSSVLEALVGRDFLPRGSEIVTRRPLVLQLIKTTEAPPGKPLEWAEFLHVPGKVFNDFARVRQEIQMETDRLVGTNKNVSEKPIRLKIFSPRVLTMTLVDLPGLTKVPVGDQPSNIEARIRDMVLEYIRPPNCIILAVSPANSDLATSDGLQMAQVVDPEGMRTIGVMTKLDIMDRGTHAAAILRNQHIPLRLGYVGVVNRCQEDINKNTSMDDARKSEDAFFAGKPEYRELQHHCGTTNLARRLNGILVDHIRTILPALRRRVADALEARQRELRGYGDAEPLQGRSAKGAFLLQMLCDYCERVSAMLDGRHQDLSMTELSGGARIRYVFTEVYGKGLAELAPQRDVRDDEISTVIKNGAGVAGNLLVPQEPFELLVRRAVATLLAPALQCKECVYEELLKIADQARPKETARFPALQRALSAAVLDFIRQGAEPTERMIRSLLECEHDYINCDHPEFIGGKGAIRAVMQERGLRQAKKESEAAAAATNSAADGGSSHPLPSRGNSRSTPPPTDGKTNGLASALSPSIPSASLGLKGLPEPSHHYPSSDSLVRGRRRSDDGDASGSSHWFSWFNSRSDVRGSSDMRSNGSIDDSALMLLPRMPVSSRSRSEAEDVEVEVIRKLVDSYFGIVRKTALDQVPKAIMHFMVNHLKRGMQQHLIRTLYRDDIIDNLLAEHEDIIIKRAACAEALGALQAAAKALEELPADLTTYSVVSADSNGSDVGSLAPLSSRRMDRHPSMAVAARVAASAAASINGGSSANLNGLD